MSDDKYPETRSAFEAHMLVAAKDLAESLRHIDPTSPEAGEERLLSVIEMVEAQQSQARAAAVQAEYTSIMKDILALR